jgi:hypothetical protein
MKAVSFIIGASVAGLILYYWDPKNKKASGHGSFYDFGIV